MSMLSTYFLGLVLLTLLGSSLSQHSKCPTKTVPYPYLHRPDSCYLFLDWKVPANFWSRMRNGPESESIDEYDQPIRKRDKDLVDAVLEVDRARKICREIGYNDMENTRKYQHLRHLSFRLPIIESQDEDDWLRQQIVDQAIAGTHFWIDLEYDPRQDEYFWHTTGDFVDDGNYFPIRQGTDPFWDDKFVRGEKENETDNTCFEFFINYGQTQSRGWRKRVCTPTSENGDTVWRPQDIGLASERQLRLQREVASFAIVCELPMYDEPIRSTGKKSPKDRRLVNQPTTEGEL